jgi:hypothetical protein
MSFVLVPRILFSVLMKQCCCARARFEVADISRRAGCLHCIEPASAAVAASLGRSGLRSMRPSQAGGMVRCWGCSGCRDIHPSVAGIRDSSYCPAAGDAVAPGHASESIRLQGVDGHVLHSCRSFSRTFGRLACSASADGDGISRASCLLVTGSVAGWAPGPTGCRRDRLSVSATGDVTGTTLG